MKIVLYIIVSFSVILSACSSATRYAARESGETSSGSYTENKSRASEDENIDKNNIHPLATEVGIASYYADKYNGRQTASGEIYNMYGISAAHPSYPMGTIVRVTNLSNNASLILKINDRMPDFKGRVIDLSLGAARKLGMIQSGIAKVKIDVIKWGKGR
ncbi:MAG: septal ring lytic transglycosylase RlpA family protein [Ignavibacteriaceae bacterium]